MYFKNLHKKPQLNFLMNVILNNKIFIKKIFPLLNFKIKTLSRILIFAKKKQNILLI